MPFRCVALPDTARGALWLHSMPGRREAWREFIADAQQARLGLIVCLTPRHELASLSPIASSCSTSRASSRSCAPPSFRRA